MIKLKWLLSYFYLMPTTFVTNTIFFPILIFIYTISKLIPAWVFRLDTKLLFISLLKSLKSRKVIQPPIQQQLWQGSAPDDDASFLLLLFAYLSFLFVHLVRHYKKKKKKGTEFCPHNITLKNNLCLNSTVCEVLKEHSCW